MSWSIGAGPQLLLTNHPDIDELQWFPAPLDKAPGEPPVRRCRGPARRSPTRVGSGSRGHPVWFGWSVRYGHLRRRKAFSMSTIPSIHRTFESAGGTLHFRHRPNPGKPLLLGLPGFQETADTFHFLEAFLASRFDVYFFDWRGHGESDRLAEGVYSTSMLLHDLAVFDATCLPGPYTLLGHCLGADVAALWAGLRPDRVRAALLIDGLLDATGPAEAVGAMVSWLGRVQFSHRTKVRQARPGMSDPSEAEMTLGLTHPTLSPERRAVVARLLTRPLADGRWDWHYAPDFPTRWLLLPLPRELVRELWGRVRCPTLWMLGSEGAAPPPGVPPRFVAMEEVAGHFRDLECHVIEGASSGAHNSHPEAVEARIRSFLERRGLDGSEPDDTGPAFSEPGPVQGHHPSPVPAPRVFTEEAAAAGPGHSELQYSELQYEVLHLLSRFLGIPEGMLDPQLPFTDLGIDSLGWVALLDALEKLVHRQISIAELFDFPNVEELTRHLARPSNGVPAPARLPVQDGEPRSRVLVPLETTGAERPLFLVSGILGSSTAFLPLAQRLPKNRPVYALQPAGLDGREPPRRRVEDIAARYLEEVLAVQPRGPFLLGGHSFGGLVAYEMALALRDRGDVARVLLLDTHLPSFFILEDAGEARVVAELVALLAANAGKPAAAPTGVSASEEPERYRARLREAMDAYGYRGIASKDLIELYRANRCAMAGYTPRRSDLAVTLLKAAGGFVVEGVTRASHCTPEYLSFLGWDRVVTTPVEAVEVPGDHLSMLGAPWVEELTKRVADVVRQQF